MPGTHINAYKQELQNALDEVSKALGHAQLKYNDLVAKIESDAAPATVPPPLTTSAEPVKPTETVAENPTTTNAVGNDEQTDPKTSTDNPEETK